MIKSLLIQDYALIEKIEVDFKPGLSIITGETGAGKTILIDAMSLLLGERASSDVIRKGAEKSIVEGIFEVDKNKRVKTFLSEHEHQSLLRKETHINFLDGFGNNEELLRTYKWLYTSLNKLNAELNELKEKDSIHREKRDVLEFQIKEIDAVSPQLGEEEKLASELKILENSEKLLALTNRIYEGLYESENSVQDTLSKIKNDLIELTNIDPSFDESSKECETALTLINDISDNIRKYKAKIEIEPQQVEATRERLGAINLLKKKYGGSIGSLLELRT